MKVYLAGKITKNGWREQFVPGLRDAYRDYDLGAGDEWPTLIKDGLGLGLDYVGPFFTGCDHGCAHGDYANHAISGGCVQPPVELWSGHRCIADRRTVAARCLQRIKDADVMIALVADDAHGTLVEIGYAVALGKPVYVTDHVGAEYEEQPVNDAEETTWFPFYMPGTQSSFSVEDSISGLQYLATRAAKKAAEIARCESPVEKQYLEAIRRYGSLDCFVPAVPVMGGKYRIDFADQARMLGVEIDGFDYHSSKESLIKDHQRQRELTTAGWSIFRFTGSDVYRDPDLCALQTEAWVRAVGNKAS